MAPVFGGLKATPFRVYRHFFAVANRDTNPALDVAGRIGVDVSSSMSMNENRVENVRNNVFVVMEQLKMSEGLAIRPPTHVDSYCVCTYCLMMKGCNSCYLKMHLATQCPLVPDDVKMDACKSVRKHSTPRKTLL